MQHPNCIMDGCGCSNKGQRCKRCGFDKAEDRLRRLILCQRGLTEGRYVRRLILRRETE